MSDMIVDACGAMGVMKVVILSRVPQRPMSGSVGLVVESARRQDYVNAFEWFCFHCGARVHRIEIKVVDIVKDLPPLYEAFYANERARICAQLHPGKEPPPRWAEL
jgi:3-hydroxyanthranilate 3,4-dioxygenase